MAARTPETTSYDSDGVVAEVSRPPGPSRGLAVLAHGAGGNRDAMILRAIAAELCAEGLVVARIDLPYRQRRPKGPPSPSTAAADRAGIVAACTLLREESEGPLIVGGHSYGGRQASMAVAENPGFADGLLLSSYPLHPPGKPERLRTEHLPSIEVPTVIIHGSTDPFATPDELATAVALIPAPVRVVEIEKVGHNLNPDRKPTAALTAEAVTDVFFTPGRA
ncbi:alpha/beta fold hydrolase [Gordonia sp. SID5947]|uniref:alpha/beta hydrolase family protein n=1 Tax=Gordonia sp. SID5947 TaxID=2690315 RepID=UPI0013718E49|nr:alpha/beta fold hydrolase [Gordonia sp. SID5947]MYR05074.1 alpha/beta fold hydrolase [Gordonia sp. SID5947]